MKRIVILSVLAASMSFFGACTTDNDGGGGGGGVVTPPVHATLYSAGDATNVIGVYDFTPEGIMNGSRTITSQTNAGMFYLKGTDELVINSKEQRSVSVYGPVTTSENGSSIGLRMSSDVVLTNPHDVAVSGDFYVVADGETGTGYGRYYVFQRTSDGISLRNTVNVSYDVWGIEFIGNDLYATVAKSNGVAVFKNFLTDYTTDAFVVPNKRIIIEGITDVRGIGYDEGVVVLTDVGQESHTSDGGFHYIAGFVQKFNDTPEDGTLAFTGKQVRVWGGLTKLGNPVAIDYDHSRNLVFVAENVRDGGAILFFENVEAGGDLRPQLTYRLPGASSVYFQKRN